MKDSNTVPAAPVAKIKPAHTTHHGIGRTDDYAWLRAGNWREVMRDPGALASDIASYLDAENAHTEAVMAETEALQKTLFAELRGRIKEDESTVPARDGPYRYFIAYDANAEHPRYCREPRGGGRRETLVDGNALSQGEAYFNLGALAHSPDHKLCAYSADRKGSEYYTITVRRLDDGTDLAERIEDTAGLVVWASDSKTLFYVRLDDNHRPDKVYRHVLGTPVDDDALVYEEPDPGFFVSVDKTQSSRFIVIDAHDHQTSEVRLIKADTPNSDPVLVAKRETGHEYDVEHQGEHLIIRTNRDGAQDFKLMTAPVGTPGPDHWRELVGHREGCIILAHTAYAGRLVRLEREDGLPRIVIRDAGGAEQTIAFEEDAYQLGLSPGYEYDTGTLRFSYSSPATPAQVFDYDMASGTRTLRKTQEVPSGHDPSHYRTARIFAPADDGEQVPVTLLWHRETALDGSAPLLLYGYGAYGIAIPAAFSTNRLSLVDRGFVYAIAHIRGGKEKGYRWYRHGRGRDKINTFRDFISAARHLIEQNYTARGRIVGHGGSAGGMLMGAVANMAPELFGAIIAEVPFVDVLTTMLDDSLPLTPPEWPEWGNPIDDAEAYRTIAAYSPCDNVCAQAYPPILALAGLTDPRVTYWEPAKWVAKLRALKINDAPLLLKTNMEAGHGGASGRFDRLHEVALAYAFALKTCGQD